jgi:excisionase family DNA binding protein
MPQKSDTIASPELLTVIETAKLLRISQGTVRAWVLNKKIPYVKLGSRVLFRQTDLNNFISRSTVQPVKAA